MIGLDQVAVVYARGAPPDSEYTVVLQASLPCRLSHISSTGVGIERVELAAMRRMLWGPEYAMPEDVEIVVGSERWATVRGTFAALRGPTGQVIYRRCDVIRKL